MTGASPCPSAIVGSKHAAGVAPDAGVVVGLERLERAQEAAVGERQEALARVLDVPAVRELPGLGPGLAAVVGSRDEVPNGDESFGDRVVRRPAEDGLVERDDDRDEAAVGGLRERAAAQVPAGGQRAHERAGEHAPGRPAVVAPDQARPSIGALRGSCRRGG